jgi:hypothetical protein
MQGVACLLERNWKMKGRWRREGGRILGTSLPSPGYVACVKLMETAEG